MPQGQIISTSLKTNHGVIKEDETEAEILFRSSALESAPGPFGDELVGQVVHYNTVETADGPRATDVRVCGWRPPAEIEG